ncbi:reverse transcriptase domain-containing protein [Tanacetum coccineum]|uniref:Reverse transcriptase domain-containing protein n=1 Tax=Tanacetum coccineum TaxID=301880 RepID=A0ABQ5H1G2_9ASTR
MMYLAASTKSISEALFAKREEEQVPIYFVSRVLQGDELNYPGMEKLILALVHAAKRLRRYFQAHMITVLTNSPIKQTQTKPKKSGRVAKWAIKLGEHDIVFQKRGDKTPKDFLIEFPLEDNEKKAEEKADTKLTKTELSCEWKLFTDGATSSDGDGNYKPGNLRRLTVVGKSNKRITKQGYYWPSMHRDAAKILQDCEKFRVPRTISSKDEKHFQEGIFIDLCKGLKVIQYFFPITEHMEIMNHIKKQLARSQQGWVDDIAQVPWVYRTLPRNSQKETPFSLTYGSEAIIPIPENNVTKDDRGRIKEVDKKRGNKEIALIE